MDDVYEHLADALNRLPNGFPRTATGVELRILQKIFAPEEAALAARLTGEMEPVDAIAARVGLPEETVLPALKAMARRGLVWGDKHEGERRFRLAPFVVGIYEGHLERMDHEFAHLFEEYMAAGGTAGIMGVQPALHRVVPARGAAKTEWILPYDDVKALLMDGKTFRVRDCICRVQQKLIGKGCDKPLHTCLVFYSIPLPPEPNDITLDEALALLDMTEAAALVHTVSNVAKGVSYVCNCCGCCCGILRGITEYGLADSVAAANYYAVVDEIACTGCGICESRCQVGAIAVGDAVAAVDRARCIGCGLCASGCPEGAVALHLKPEAEIVHPPEDFAAWERARLRNRGMA
ncbi:MAG: 4Fe-4S binding protein [Chloroflexi bacterium]|nr:4Fe-4S binding protein [Chloroflexota bacterium]